MSGTILVIDNDPESAAALDSHFSAMGYDVITTASGKEAVEQARQKNPDLILLDTQLPDMDGYEVYRKIRRNWRSSWIPVIFYTEDIDRDARIAGLSLGAVDYLPKSIDLEELGLRIRNILARAQFNNLLDPITSLPGNRLLNQQLEGLLNRSHWTVLTLTILGLESFGEQYGFVTRNEVLRATALLMGKLTDQYGGPNAFIGDAGGGNFVIITNPESAGALESSLVTQLEQTLSYFYPIADREKMSGEQVPNGSELRVSIGSVSGDGNGMQEIEDILALARAHQRTVSVFRENVSP